MVIWFQESFSIHIYEKPFDGIGFHFDAVFIRKKFACLNGSGRAPLEESEKPILEEGQ
ncbi:MAG TPA: hypothetical protein VI895_13750 [Bdellovibrionota bacterium]|nr:hypothetical protein [Bdellovibrionota bacterium]